MTMTERTVWATLAVFPLVGIVYFTVILTQAADRPLEEVSWVTPMLWAWGSLIVFIILGTIASAIATAIQAEVAGQKAEFEDGDVRDKEIERNGNARAYVMSSFGGLVATILLMLDVDRFWPANTLFLAGLLAGIIAAGTRARAYRTGL
ncbi:hypothetical protein [Demequina mangrovi]|uniref:DUF2178 domain-containing protein n=1 Tax=Demequina mangrovi TaxID=1043493 RepID=A0A1H6VI61_9MICO|nr:hypothetical protein [Demequina mangrovi]SEJ00022.1 hypothetical protein SAMN05421637_0691 [Demequina mangrovi]